VFSTARRCNPCVIFFDELEAIFGSREANGNLSNKVDIRRMNNESLLSFTEALLQKLISQLMMELDNLSQGKERVLVVTATNHPEKIDRAILRPGKCTLIKVIMDLVSNNHLSILS
jgi:SpoVK/Ycf46/Vps4 family AAA+-type ATPase